MKWYESDVDAVEELVHTDKQNGLSESEAKKRISKFGYNQLAEGKKVSALSLFLSQFKDFMVFVLLVATFISGLLGEYIDAVAISAIIFLNALLGYYQERRAEKSLEALKQLSSPQTTVLRDGEWRKVPSQELVVGDIVKFTSGSRIGADLRLIRSDGVEIEESALTGESVPVSKQVERIEGDLVELGDQANIAFMGTLVTRGSGVGIVIGTGMNTAMGQIAGLLESAPQQVTPLQRRLEQLGKILIVCALGLTVLVVALGIMQGHDMYKMFLAGVSLAVAAIPEGLPAIVTVALSLGVQRMIKRKAIVRRLSAVETLGCASVICSDKTGTMTQNKMTVTTIYASGKKWSVTGTGYQPEGCFFNGGTEIRVSQEKALQQLLSFGLLVNHANIAEKNAEYVLDGDPTEGALVVAAMKAGLSREPLLEQYTVVHEFPFDSKRKMMSMVVEDENGDRYVVTKGAPDILLQKSEWALWHERKQPMSAKIKKSLEGSIESMGGQALRTIAVGFKPLRSKHESYTINSLEKDLIFVGLFGMIDPPRPEVKNAIRECREAGIKTVMITGDHAITATAIASSLDLLPPGGRVMDGYELSQLSVDELEDVVEDVYVFARVSPEHKLKIVQALQQRGHITAMTGDGVNDAPAIKAADIGISMGTTGTDVAKEASALVLMDDNFATIKEAIKEGRNIYENIRKFIRYLLASNVGEILVMLFAMLMALPLPLVPIQILWVNLVTDGLPAMALGMDKPEGDVMKRNPRHPREGVFSRGLGWKVLSRGFLIGLVTLLVFLFTYRGGQNELIHAQTAAFATLVMAQLIHVFDCRSDYSVYHRNPFGNVYLLFAVVSSILLMMAVIYYPPLQPIFHTVSLAAHDWLLILGLAGIPTFVFAGKLLSNK
ncbi:cation-translocating P-type ATPase [Bacillus solimangrovi]|uniref:P-type Ca(2+) transporter n=1 Tax=Bacillus solimangrovi TaxID=1305675 RepID=A0A1E5LAV4_9BACI|nr:cation-translocating P-type ATPase [Bacillus solimangrovi]OEH91206.1 ATPase [Bacillus solimangrovi]